MAGRADCEPPRLLRWCAARTRPTGRAQLAAEGDAEAAELYTIAFYTGTGTDTQTGTEPA